MLTEASNALRQQAVKNHDGTGLAGMVEGAMRIDKTPDAAYATNLLSVSPILDDSPSVLGHIRYKTVGPQSYDNTHPYRSSDGSMAFAHNGELSHLDALRSELGDELLARIPSTNDSGFWGAMAMRDVGELGTERGLNNAVHWMDRHAPDSISGNFIMLRDDGTLLGVRTHDINTLGISPTGIEAARRGAADLGDAPGWYVSSEAAAPTHPWNGLRTREAFEIDPDLNLHTWMVD